MFDVFSSLIVAGIFAYACLVAIDKLTPIAQSIWFAVKYRFRNWNRERKRRYILLLDGVIVPDNQMITKFDKVWICFTSHNSLDKLKINFIQTPSPNKHFHGFTTKEYREGIIKHDFQNDISEVYILRYQKGTKTKLYF